MRMRHIVWKELRHRKLSTCVVVAGVALCIGLIVSIQQMSLGAIDEMRRAMLEMGKNLVILPEGVDEKHYWSGDFSEAAEPLYEDDVRTVAHYCIYEHQPSILARHFIGSFQRAVTIDGVPLVLSGIMVEIDPKAPKSVTREAQQPLADGTAELGFQAARKLGLRKGDTLSGKWEYRGEVLAPPEFSVTKVRSETGTVQDFKVFLNSSAARRIFGIDKEVVNVIEAVSCMCSPQSLPLLAERIERKLRELGRDVNASHFLGIVEARRQAREGTTRDANILSVAILAFGILLIGGYSALNAIDRRREAGVLLAIAALPRHVAWLMLQKMIVIGLLGGILGCLAAQAVLHGAGMSVVQKLHPAMRSYVLALTGWEMFGLSLAISVTLAVLPGLVGVVLAARTDPAETLREV